jgi:hypothetical protein
MIKIILSRSGWEREDKSDQNALDYYSPTFYIYYLKNSKLLHIKSDEKKTLYQNCSAQ